MSTPQSLTTEELQNKLRELNEAHTDLWRDRIEDPETIDLTDDVMFVMKVAEDAEKARLASPASENAPSAPTSRPARRSPMVTQRRKQLATAFGKLNCPPGLKAHMYGAIEALSQVDATGSGTIPERFRNKDSKKGRPHAVREHAVTIITGYAYSRITGKRPTLTVPVLEDHYRPQGTFYELLQSVFRILGLKKRPEHFVKEIMVKLKVPGVVRKERKKKNTPPEIKGLTSFRQETDTPAKLEHFFSGVNHETHRISASETATDHDQQPAKAAPGSQKPSDP